MGAAVSNLVSYDTELANWNFTTLTAMETGFKSTQTFTIALPIFSGLIGVWAEKAFPTMLIAPGSFYLQIRFAKVAQAFQFTMDPCRRIFGTYRDYVPSIGPIQSGYITEHSANVPNHGRRKYVAQNTGLNTWLAITDHGANGTDFAYKGYRIHPVTAAYGAYDVQTTAPAPDPNDPDVVTVQSSIENTYNYATLLAESFKANNLYTANKSALLALSENDGYATGNPKPQYVSVQNPSCMVNGFLILKYQVIQWLIVKNMKVVLVLICLHLHRKFVVQQLHQIHLLVNWILVI